jgi:hypothetical protein
LNKEDFEN